MHYLFSSALVLFLTVGCTRIPIEEQVRVVGSREFVPEQWAAATPVEREQMLASFFAKHPADKLTSRQVKQLLGAPTGYYDYDENLAYFIGPELVGSRYGNERMLVFITDKRTGRVEQVELIPPKR